MVAQKVVQLRDAVRKIGVANAIHNVNALASVRVEHVKTVDLSRGQVRIRIFRFGNSAEAYTNGHR
jgi:hypothetical protein